MSLNKYPKLNNFCQHSKRLSVDFPAPDLQKLTAQTPTTSKADAPSPLKNLTPFPCR